MTSAIVSEQQAAVVPDADYATGGRWKYHLTVLGMASAVLLAALVLQVANNRVYVPGVGPLPGTCTWRRMFAMDCPGCGLTRCFVVLADGQVAQAWHFNPAGLLLFAVMVYQFPFRLVQLWRLRQGKIDYRHGAWTIHLVIWGALAALIFQWFWRNVIV